MKPFDPRLLTSVPRVRRPLLALAAMGVANGVLTVATAFAVSATVVAVVGSGDLSRPLFTLAVLFLARAALAAASEQVSAWAGVQVSTGLRAALARTWATSPAAARPEPGRAVTLLTSGAGAVEPYAARFLPTLVTAAVVPALAVGVLLVIDWPSALVVICTLPLLPLFAALIGHATEERTRTRWAAMSLLAGHFLDAVRGLPTLVTYGRAERQVTAVREVSERHRAATMGTLRLAFLSSAALELLASICVAIVAVVVGLRLSYGTMALGVGLTAILLAPEAYWPIRRVGAEFHNAADGATALAEILDHLAVDRDTPESDAAHPRPGVGDLPLEPGLIDVAVRDLHVNALSGITLTAGPGLTVLTGPSGVGKSTLLETIAGLRSPDSGEVRCGPMHLVTQRPFLSAPTVRDNLTLAGPVADGELWAALREVGLDGVVAAMPAGLGTALGDDGFGLSAGQRQRLALARAVLSREPVLLLDEPTAHLDGTAASEIAQVIATLAERRTVIAVTHRPELVALADQHLHLSSPSVVSVR